jgi:hypothetical protein
MSKHASSMLALIFLVALSIILDNQVAANPYIDYIMVPPLVSPSINIISPPENNTIHNTNNLTINFTATMRAEENRATITLVKYKASWQPENITLYDMTANYPYLPEYLGSMVLNEIPEGKQTVTFFVHGRGDYEENLVLYYFGAVATQTVEFTVDTVPPVVSVLGLENETFVEPEVPLSFVTDESTSRISYVLDAQANVTIDRNATLTGLSKGSHNVTVYVWDNAGNIGASETIFFTVAERFPTTLVIGALIASVAAISLGLLVWFRKTLSQRKL